MPISRLIVEKVRFAGGVPLGDIKTVLEGQNKPVYDEVTLAKLLEAAYVMQEHNRRMKALGVRIVLDDLQDLVVRDQLRKDQARTEPDFPAGPTESTRPATGSESGVAATDDYTLTLARIVETQRQIQLRSLDLDQAMAMVAQRVTAIARSGGAAIGILESGKVRYPAVAGLMTPRAGEAIAAEKALCAAALRGEIVRCRDIEIEIALDADECRRRGIQAMIAVPIYQVGGIAGGLELYYASKHAFTEHDVHTCQLMAGLVTEVLARRDERNWKESIASERSVMLEALEKLKPDLAALANGASGDAAAKAAVRTAASPFSCRKCGNELVGEEQFCGQCGWPRATDSDRQATAPIWLRPPALEENPPAKGAGTATETVPEFKASFDESRPEQPLADSLIAEMPDPFAEPGTEPAPTAPVEAAAETDTKSETEDKTSDAKPHALAWTSARATREFLEQLAGARPPSALVRFWNARRGDFYLAIAVLLVACVLRWGIWSNHPVKATGKPPVPAAQQKSAPDADLSLFDRILIKLGLAVPPEAPENKGNPDAMVWVDLHTGLYYCPGTDLYGKTPKGKLTKQRDAQLDRYEPAYNKACE